MERQTHGRKGQNHGTLTVTIKPHTARRVGMDDEVNISLLDSIDNGPDFVLYFRP